jgi:cell division protein FtsW
MHKLTKGFLPMAGAVGLAGGLLMLQPDLGAAGVVVCIAMGILFLGGFNIVWFGGIAGVLAAVFSLIILFSPWRRERLTAYLDPWADGNVLGKAYQLSHSLIAFGRGELFGVGLGGSVEKLHYLPEAHTDFLMAVIGEELGLAGVLLVTFLFYFIVRRAFDIGRQAIATEKFFAGLVAKGIGIWIGVQAFINMGVNLGLLPTKGLTLPLMSFGGSGIVTNCIGIAILLRIDYENRILMRGSRA